jgi:uncharacterized delta-60 repeat protein
MADVSPEGMLSAEDGLGHPAFAKCRRQEGLVNNRRGRTELGIVLVLVVVGVLFAHVAVSVAAPGDLDPAFGAGGIALASLGGGLDKATAMAVQPDGGYIVAGVHTDATTLAQTCTVKRFLADGSLDPGFGSSWGTGVNSPEAAKDWRACQILVDGQGRIYLYLRGATGSDFFYVMRLLSDGSVDATFGASGVVGVRFTWPYVGMSYMALYPGGGLVVGGTDYDLFHLKDISIWRLQEDGSIDMTFGTDGLARIDVAAGSDDALRSLAVAANGDILVRGDVQWRDVVLVRLTPSGVLSPTFGSGGMVALSSWVWADPPGAVYQRDILERSDGTILLNSGYQLKRVTAAGNVDTTYGVGGTLKLLGEPWGTFGVSTVLVQPDGGIVCVGTVDNGFPSYKDLLVTRYLADGSVDTGFGANGAAITNLGGADDCAAAAFDPSGKLVVAGYAYPAGAGAAARQSGLLSGREASTFGMGLVRYLAGPSAPVVPATPVKPVLTKLSPTTGKRGITVTLTGKNFGARRTASFVKFGATKVGKYVSWSTTRIKCRVPAKAKYGRVKVVVVTVGGASSVRTFTVKR